MSLSAIAIPWIIIGCCLILAAREIFLRPRHSYRHCRYCAQPAPHRDLRVTPCSECGKTHLKGARPPGRHRHWWVVVLTFIIGLTCGGYLAGPVEVANFTPSFILARIAPITMPANPTGWAAEMEDEFFARKMKSEYLERIYLQRWLAYVAPRNDFFRVTPAKSGSLVSVKYIDPAFFDPYLRNVYPVMLRIVTMDGEIVSDRYRASPYRATQTDLLPPFTPIDPQSMRPAAERDTLPADAVTGHVATLKVQLCCPGIANLYETADGDAVVAEQTIRVKIPGAHTEGH